MAPIRQVIPKQATVTHGQNVTWTESVSTSADRRN
jgi:hypothetical protein